MKWRGERRRKEKYKVRKVYVKCTDKKCADKKGGRKHVFASENTPSHTRTLNSALTDTNTVCLRAK